MVTEGSTGRPTSGRPASCRNTSSAPEATSTTSAPRSARVRIAPSVAASTRRATSGWSKAVTTVGTLTDAAAGRTSRDWMPYRVASCSIRGTPLAPEVSTPRRQPICHVTPEVVPPALAIAEQRGSSGAELLHAVALGMEVTTRVGVALNYQAFRDRGFHSPGITGPFGGATAVGLLTGLDADQLTHAYGIAAGQASGTWAQLGSPTIKFQQAHGAMSGLLAATLAARSFTATEDGLGAADGGLFTSCSDGGDPDALVRDFGAHWELRRISLRPSPAAAYLQGVVTAMLALVREHDMKPESVESIRLGLSDTGYALHGELDPKDRFQARLSARYVAAVVLADRQCWLEQFTAQRFADDELIRFARERVGTAEDPAVRSGGATVEVRLVDGETVRFTAAVPKGDPGDPLSFAEVAEKFRRSAAGKLSDAVCERTVQTVRELDSLGDVATLLEPLRT